MIKSGSASRLVAFCARISPLVRFTGGAGLAIALLANVAATSPNALSPDEQYIQIMAMIDRADALRKSGQMEAAHVRYLQAEKALLAFKAANPLFEPKTVAYRLKEVTDRADERPAVPAQTNSSTTKPGANLEAESSGAKETVKLLEAGAEPRSTLRYHIKPGDKQMALVTTKVKLDVPMPPAQPGAAPQQVPNIPAISIPMDITVQGIAPNGDITFQSVMGEATLVQDTNTPPEVAQAMQTALAGIKGVTGTSVITSRGLMKKSDIKTPATANAQARQFIEQIKQATTSLSLELPEEAVGVGAKWQVKQQTKVQAATVEQTGTYELTALDGDKLTAKFNETEEAAGKAAAATGISGSVSGTATVDLSKVVAPAVEVHIHNEVPMGRDKNVLMKMDISISIEAQ